jgi:hypothetical protein
VEEREEKREEKRVVNL